MQLCILTIASKHSLSGLFSTFDMDSIERVWIQDVFCITDWDISEKSLYISTPSIKSILLGFLNSELLRDQL